MTRACEHRTVRSVRAASADLAFRSEPAEVCIGCGAWRRTPEQRWQPAGFEVERLYPPGSCFEFAPARPAGVFSVLRYVGRDVARLYGPFEDRETAERVAQRAAEKYPAHRVVVAPKAAT